MIEIVLVEDHAIVRQGLELMFQDEPSFKVIGSFESGEAFRKYIRSRSPILEDERFVLVLDISLPGKSGFEILRMMRDEHPCIPVLVLSMHQEETMAIRALQAGAAGYLNKDVAPDVLKTALAAVHGGEKHVSPAVASKIVGQLQGTVHQLPHEKLSEREFEVFLLLSSGLSNKEISEKLALSSKTVSTYKSRILKKLCLKGVGDIVKYTVSHSLSVPKV